LDEALIFGPKMLQEIIEIIKRIQEHIKVAQSRQKSYAVKRMKPMEHQVADKVFLKVLPTRGIKRFGV